MAEKPGYILIGDEVLTRTDLTDGDKIVLGLLSRLQSNKAFCYPSLTTIARMTGRSRRNAVRSVKRLSELGEIVILPPSGRFKTNLYSVKSRTARNLRAVYAERSTQKRRAKILAIAGDKKSPP